MAKQAGLGGIYRLPNVDCNIQREAIEEVSSAKISSDLCAIPESTNESLVKAKQPHIEPNLTSRSHGG